MVGVAKGYTVTFIFECKNWEDAVGKNEIIIFSEKIDAVSAQRGYFVAKSFTRDAEAQALKDPRMTRCRPSCVCPTAYAGAAAYHSGSLQTAGADADRLPGR